MILRIIAVGRLKEKHWQQGAMDYSTRIQPYAHLEIVEVPEARAPEKISPAEKEKVMALEGKAILEKLSKRSGLVVALDRQGKEMDSQELARWLESQILEGHSDINWVIGGPLGLAPSVLERADLVLSFSKMTFPHQMARLILLEQIYRSLRIIRHEPYHR